MDSERKELCHCLQRWAAGGSGGCCWLAGHICPAGLILQISLLLVDVKLTSCVLSWTPSLAESECMDSVECHRSL